MKINISLMFHTLHFLNEILLMMSFLFNGYRFFHERYSNRIDLLHSYYLKERPKELPRKNDKVGGPNLPQLEICPKFVP